MNAYRVDYPDGRVAGHITRGSCENPACHEGERDGRPWHATPQGFAVTLPTYHYATIEKATEAILSASSALEDRLRLRTVSALPTDGDAVDGWGDVIEELSQWFAHNREHARQCRDVLVGLPYVDTWAEVIQAAAERIRAEAFLGFLDEGYSELAEERLLDALHSVRPVR